MFREFWRIRRARRSIKAATSRLTESFRGNLSVAQGFLALFCEEHGRRDLSDLSVDEVRHLSAVVKLVAPDSRHDGAQRLSTPELRIDCRACNQILAAINDGSFVDPLTFGDNEHLGVVRERGPHPTTLQIRRALGLLSEYLANAPARWEDTFANDLAGVACLARAYRQIRAATLLCHMGYYSEVRLVVRGAYESAALARYLAREPAQAEKWLLENIWVPDRVVRRWLQEEGKTRMYASFYQELSAAAHPTSHSCLPLLDVEDERYAVRLDSRYDESMFEALLQYIMAATLFVCFAARNAAASEMALPPHWRLELTNLARDFAPATDWSHLERDWEREWSKWERLADRARPADELESSLEENPPPWRSLLEDDE